MRGYLKGGIQRKRPKPLSGCFAGSCVTQLQNVYSRRVSFEMDALAIKRLMPDPHATARI